MNAPGKETIQIPDLDTMVSLLSAWHKKEVATLKHMLQIPKNTAIYFGEDAPIVLTGDMLKGFMLGITISLLRLGELPFVVETEDAPVAESNVTT